MSSLNVNNDFAQPLMITYEDRHHHFVIIPPQETMSIGIIAQDKIIDADHISVLLFGPKDGTYIPLKFEDLKFVKPTEKP